MGCLDGGKFSDLYFFMSSVAEIEAAIEKLPASQVNQLASWFEDFCQRRDSSASVESWLHRARGAALAGANTDEILNLSRAE